MKLRNVPRNVPRYLRRCHLRHRNSSPFLSGDLFADNADVQVYGPKNRVKQPSLQMVSEARVIFCPSHYFERFLDEYSGAINARVLILGNSDRDFEFIDRSILPRSVKKVFAQNLLAPDKHARVLPIGLENLRLGTNGLTKFYRDVELVMSKENKVLVGPLSMTHPERYFYNEPGLDELVNLFVLRGRVSPKKYAEIARRFSYIASPRGNGMDTHRFWESLYHGSYPVVLRSGWSEQVRNLKLPVVEIDSWEDLGAIKLDFVSRAFEPSRLEPLWWNYWQAEFKKVV